MVITSFSNHGRRCWLVLVRCPPMMTPGPALGIDRTRQRSTSDAADDGPKEEDKNNKKQDESILRR
jgi:hypothetical protein